MTKVQLVIWSIQIYNTNIDTQYKYRYLIEYKHWNQKWKFQVIQSALRNFNWPHLKQNVPERAKNFLHKDTEGDNEPPKKIQSEMEAYNTYTYTAGGSMGFKKKTI